MIGICDGKPRVGGPPGGVVGLGIVLPKAKTRTQVYKYVRCSSELSLHIAQLAGAHVTENIQD